MTEQLEACWRYFQANRLDEAEACFGALVASGRELSGAYYGLGLIRLHKRNEEAAWKYFTRAVDAEPTNINALLCLADLAATAGDRQMAISLYSGVLVQKPDTSSAISAIAELAGMAARSAGSADSAGSVPPRQIATDGGRGAARYDINEQRADMINNVGRDQFLFQQRENFLREIAATKTRARYLIVAGFLLFVVGFAMFASGILSFVSQGPSINGLDPSADFPTPFGDRVFGVPLGVLGWSMSAVGAVLAIVGIILHVVATSRRKRVDREFPNPGSYGSYR